MNLTEFRDAIALAHTLHDEAVTNGMTLINEAHAQLHHDMRAAREAFIGISFESPDEVDVAAPEPTPKADPRRKTRGAFDAFPL